MFNGQGTVRWDVSKVVQFSNFAENSGLIPSSLPIFFILGMKKSTIQKM